ncbi:hypothetical protein [Campylobacter ureolyticus]|uniref:hypothetical protein n=1 Tax=Campylobacter ureolyticus TaxID=827 RepID=UPI0022B32529|nr:hypothetical protein [Campylobacter ureolyticus]MCZ6167423.1 hypothetical protein [Campylobacter ureolyticus]
MKKANIEIKKPFLDDMSKKELAKIGLSVSMGLTVLSAFSLKSKFSKNLHVISGALMVGFAFYHNSLYDKNSPVSTSKQK